MCVSFKQIIRTCFKDKKSLAFLHLLTKNHKTVFILPSFGGAGGGDYLLTELKTK